MDKEVILSDYIDELIAQREPDKTPTHDSELTELMETVKLVHTCKDVWPDSDYPKKLARTAAETLQSECASRPRRKSGYPRRWIFTSAAALIAMFLILAWLVQGDIFHSDVAYAMQKATGELTSYHAVMETRSHNQAGQQWMVRKIEVWVKGNQYAVKQSDGTLTVNNGERKWQVRPNRKEVALLPLAPDPTRSGLDLKEEAKRAGRYPHKVSGTEVIAGRETTRLQILPPGGLPYYIWVDKETNLPVKLQTAMQNSLQTTYTFVKFQPNIEIEGELFAYQPPAGYKITADDPGQLAASLTEAAAISQLSPLCPREVPLRIVAFKERIVLDYGDTTIIETKARGDFEPADNSALGQAAGGVLEIGEYSLKWRQNGIDIEVNGERRVSLARQIAADLTLPDSTANLAGGAKVTVPVDMEIARADQQQIDAGHTPWQLDPLQVALTFVNLKVSPQGIVGEPQIGETSFTLLANNGIEALVGVNQGPIEKVYLQRLVRKDSSGIWSVVGYDPR